ncbi:MAG: dihydropteroate synthase [Armatimonadota bacterium]
MNDVPFTHPTRADQGVRILSTADPESVRREIVRVGSAEKGVAIMTSKGVFRLVRLERVPTEAANIVKQEMLAHGGDAAIHAQTPNCDIARTDVVLMGTEEQLILACNRLKMYGNGLSETADIVIQALEYYDAPGSELYCGPYTLLLGAKTYIMGILNITPDSFSGDGLAGSLEQALQRAEVMIADGADILDIGGESTRPGAEPVPLEEELSRVVPLVRALAARFPVPISVDTYKSAVARAALDAGATLINDISGLRFDPAMAGVVAAAKAPVVIMHIKGTPRTMQQQPSYQDLMTEVCDYLQESTAIAAAAGIPRDQVILDPGFGFGKTVEHNLELVRRLRELTSYGQPVLLGTSRKSTIGKVLGDLPPQERVEGTAATVALGIANGADIVRVHDVKEMARVAKVTDAIVR